MDYFKLFNLNKDFLYFYLLKLYYLYSVLFEGVLAMHI